MRFLRAAVPGFIVIACICRPGIADRLPVPSAPVQAAADKLVREAFKTGTAVRREDQRALATKLLDEAAKSDSTDDNASRYVLMRDARDLAATAGDYALADRAIASLSETFEIDPATLKAALMATARSAHAVTAIPVALQYADEATNIEDYPAAERFLGVARDLADRAHDLKTLTRVRASVASIHAQALEHERIQQALAKLKQNPEDPESTLVVGKWLCFEREKWKDGLPLLAKSSDSVLADLAKSELADQKDAGKLADAWWDAAHQKSASGRTRDGEIRRAAHWYTEALPLATGLRLKLTEARIAEAAIIPSPGHPTYLTDLKEVSVANIQVDGYWGLGKNGFLDRTSKSPIQVNGVRYPHGMGLNPVDGSSARITYSLDGHFTHLAGMAALNDSGKGYFGSTLTFRIFGDGRELWSSKPSGEFGVTYPFDIDVTGVKQLVLAADCAGGAAGAHAVWLDPQLSAPK